MKNLNQLLKHLLIAKIDFVLIGGYAGVVHGSNQLTRDLDICMALSEENINKLRENLKDFHPKHRMNPNFKPSFLNEPKSIRNDLNALYLETDLGILDIIQEVTQVGDFNTLKSHAITIDIFGQPCQVISLDDLIKAKEAMGREKDKSILKELYAIKESLKK